MDLDIDSSYLRKMTVCKAILQSPFTVFLVNAIVTILLSLDKAKLWIARQISYETFRRWTKWLLLCWFLLRHVWHVAWRRNGLASFSIYIFLLNDFLWLYLCTEWKLVLRFKKDKQNQMANSVFVISIFNFAVFVKTTVNACDKHLSNLASLSLSNFLRFVQYLATFPADEELSGITKLPHFRSKATTGLPASKSIKHRNVSQFIVIILVLLECYLAQCCRLNDFD